jgi:2-iminobutanoate/2-iminopropanoate deaminase
MTSKEVVSTAQAPAAIGPYSQAIRSGSMLFCSGQIPLDPKTMTIVPGGIREQTRQVLRNLSAVIAASGLKLDRIVKTTIFVKDLGTFADLNAEYESHFKEAGVTAFPARSTVEVSRLPKDVLVEIEAILIG